MELTEAQVETYEAEGYLFFESLFSPREVAVLEAAMPAATDPARPEVSLDEASGTVRLSHGPHLYSEAFRRLSRHPRLARPAAQLLGSDVYIYQTRLTIKAGLGAAAAASGWPWHQDFSTWYVADGMPEPRAVAVFVFLDEVTACNAPLMIIPRSQHAGLISRPLGRFDDQEHNQPESSPQEYSQVIIAPETLRELARQGGVAAPLGPAGSVLFMHANMVHGSTENIAPLRRALYSVVFNSVDNRTKMLRPEHYAARDLTPLRPLAEDCLLNSPA